MSSLSHVKTPSPMDAFGAWSHYRMLDLDQAQGATPNNTPSGGGLLFRREDTPHPSFGIRSSFGTIGDGRPLTSSPSPDNELLLLRSPAPPCIDLTCDASDEDSGVDDVNGDGGWILAREKRRRERNKAAHKEKRHTEIC
jgi:hypothetical protein